MKKKSKRAKFYHKQKLLDTKLILALIKCRALSTPIKIETK